jgi:hypothetical protein
LVVALSLSWLWPLVAPEELELDGELELDWPLDEPAPAAPLLEDGELEELGLDDAPPPAFFSSLLELDEEAAPEGEEGVVALEPDGEEVEPEEDAAPEGEPPVVLPAEPVLESPQAARPRARETAAARTVSFMCSPPWLGYGCWGASFGPVGRRWSVWQSRFGSWSPSTCKEWAGRTCRRAATAISVSHGAKLSRG